MESPCAVVTYLDYNTMDTWVCCLSSCFFLHFFNFIHPLVPPESLTAKGALNGRYFGGQLVRTDVYDQNMCEHQNFSG